jgi:hypothetical protein
MGVIHRTSFFVLLAGLLMISACSDKGTPADVTPPTAPVLLPPPPDSAKDETGTDAIPEEDWIQLVWLANSEKDLQGYKIYRNSPPLETLNLLASTTVGSAESDTTYEDRSVDIGVRYVYAITAYDRSGNESSRSQEVNYMLIAKLSNENLLSPRGEIAERRPTFVWTSTGVSIENRLRVYDVAAKSSIWVSPGQNPFQSPHALPYDEDGTATDSLLVPGREYWWRVDQTGSELRSGSESRWVSFAVR